MTQQLPLLLLTCAVPEPGTQTGVEVSLASESGGEALVVMMQAAHFRDGYDSSDAAKLCRAGDRRTAVTEHPTAAWLTRPSGGIGPQAEKRLIARV